MPINNSTSIINFDRGLGRIGNMNAPDVMTEQAKSKLAPSEANTSNMVRRLQNAPTLDSQTHAAVMPQISDREILSPARFENELHSAMKALEAMREDTALGEMKSAIAEHQTLRAALQYFRETLFTG